MPSKRFLRGRDFLIASSALALTLIGSGLTISASAQEQVNSRDPIDVKARTNSFADLEQAFWICDHAATTHGVDEGAGIACGAITEDLKTRKFDGDFVSMLAWWRKNKPAEHRALSSATAFGNSESSDRRQLTIAELKTIYLDCDRSAMSGQLGAAEMAACSIVYEELKKRAFDGDFDRFLVWS